METDDSEDADCSIALCDRREEAYLHCGDHGYRYASFCAEKSGREVTKR